MNIIQYKYWNNELLGKFIIAFLNDSLVYFGNNKENFNNFIKKTGYKSQKNISIKENTTVQLEEYLSGKRKSFDINTEILIGTEFQKSVWLELSNIPYGKAISYKQLAINLGSNKLSRAVGQANSKNPIPVIVPCHRVISLDKAIGGYSLGIELKKHLLNIESVNYKACSS